MIANPRLARSIAGLSDCMCRTAVAARYAYSLGMGTGLSRCMASALLGLCSASVRDCAVFSGGNGRGRAKIC